jgi:hypothetical protein
LLLNPIHLGFKKCRQEKVIQSPTDVFFSHTRPIAPPSVMPTSSFQKFETHPTSRHRGSSKTTRALPGENPALSLLVFGLARSISVCATLMSPPKTGILFSFEQLLHSILRQFAEPKFKWKSCMIAL